MSKIMREIARNVKTPLYILIFLKFLLLCCNTFFPNIFLDNIGKINNFIGVKKNFFANFHRKFIKKVTKCISKCSPAIADFKYVWVARDILIC